MLAQALALHMGQEELHLKSEEAPESLTLQAVVRFVASDLA